MELIKWTIKKWTEMTERSIFWGRRSSMGHACGVGGAKILDMAWNLGNIWLLSFRFQKTKINIIICFTNTIFFKILYIFSMYIYEKFYMATCRIRRKEVLVHLQRDEKASPWSAEVGFQSSYDGVGDSARLFSHCEVSQYFFWKRKLNISYN